MKYRAEIDGLRTLAILPVVFFHAGFSLFSGGFVGVDIFFVISGYLITYTLVNELAQGKFSLESFYERRARRILPALLAMMAICTPFAWMWMTPERFTAFTQNMTATSFFISNYQLATSDGYFAYETAKVPLLHTWSLAIEEQFYILFPILLAFLWKFSFNKIIFVFLFIAVGSLAMTEWGWRYAPIDNFYYLHFRAWELLIGTLCALWHFKQPPQANNILSVTGLILIGLSVIVFNSATPFPSLLTLIPVAGSALIILFADKTTYAGRLLSMKPMVFIGLISYSIYIWHQPIFAFAEIRFEEHLNSSIKLLLVLAVLTCAYLSWRYIEQPFRIKKGQRGLSREAILRWSGASILAFSAAGLAMGKSSLQDDYYHANLTTEQVVNLTLIKQTHSEYDIVDNNECVYRVRSSKAMDKSRFEDCSKKYGKAVIVLGDSHGINIYNMLARQNHSQFLVGFVEHGCRPSSPAYLCHYTDFKTFAQKHSDLISHIYYHQAGSSLMIDYAGNNDTMYIFKRNEGYRFDYDKFEVTAQYLNQLSNSSKVTWVGVFTEARVDLNDIQSITKNNFRIEKKVLSIFADFEETFASQIKSKKNAFDYAPLNDTFAIDENSLRHDDCVTFLDMDHFSKCGEIIYGEKLSKYLKELHSEYYMSKANF